MQLSYSSLPDDDWRSKCWQVIFWAQVGNRQPSSSFMKEAVRITCILTSCFLSLYTTTSHKPTSCHIHSNCIPAHTANVVRNPAIDSPKETLLWHVDFTDPNLQVLLWLLITGKKDCQLWLYTNRTKWRVRNIVDGHFSGVSIRRGSTVLPMWGF